MIGLSIVLIGGLFVSSVSLIQLVFVANWTPEMITVMIGAISSLVAAVTAAVIAIINATTKAKIEQHKAISELNQQKLGELVTATDQQKVRVEELHQAVDRIVPGEKGEKGERGEKGEKGEKGNGHQ